MHQYAGNCKQVTRIGNKSRTGKLKQNSFLIIKFKHY